MAKHLAELRLLFCGKWNLFVVNLDIYLRRFLRKKNVESKKQNKQKTNKLLNTENKQVVATGEVGESIGKTDKGD